MSKILLLLTLFLSSCLHDPQTRIEYSKKIQPKVVAKGMPKSVTLKQSVTVSENHIFPSGEYIPIMNNWAGMVTYERPDGNILLRTGKTVKGGIVWYKNEDYPTRFWIPMGEIGMQQRLTEAFKGKVKK